MDRLNAACAPNFKTLLMGTVLFASIAVVMLNLLVDLLYIALDPRVRLSSL